MLYMIATFFTKESIHEQCSEFSSRRQLFPSAGKTEWKTNAPYVISYPVTQPAKVMSRYISPRKVHMKRILNKVLFFSQSIHLILAGLILNIILFFSGIFFLNLTFLLKQNQNQDEAIASSCLMLATALTSRKLTILRLVWIVMFSP